MFDCERRLVAGIARELDLLGSKQGSEQRAIHFRKILELRSQLPQSYAESLLLTFG